MAFEDDVVASGFDPRFSKLQIGQVIDRNDPKKLGRVTFKIPGLMEPEGPWAFPFGGGSKDFGTVATPPVGADIGILFKNGDPECPYYLLANWGTGEVPEEFNENYPDSVVTATETFRTEICEKAGNRFHRITNKKNGDYIEMNAEDNTVKIKATTSLIIDVVGLVDVRGAQVQINGRIVNPTPDPI